jgi:catechol 2,3-dioxygenase
MTSPASVTSSHVSLPAALRLGAAHLVVADLDRAVAWYERALGLRLHRHDTGEAALGAGGEDVLVLHEDADARPAGRTSGLYHVALLYPARDELARAAVRLAATQTPIQGASDHGTHEAIYLADADGNGLELAADRPRDAWPTPEEEFSGGGPRPLVFPALLATVEDEAPAAHVGPGLAVGHLHLHVGDIRRGLAFYRDLLGFDEWFVMPTAAFVSAGGYHHHLGFNVWRGEGAPPMPERTIGLRHWTIVLPTAADVAQVRARLESGAVTVTEVEGGFAARDPWNIAVHVVAAVRPGR